MEEKYLLHKQVEIDKVLGTVYFANSIGIGLKVDRTDNSEYEQGESYFIPYSSGKVVHIINEDTKKKWYRS